MIIIIKLEEIFNNYFVYVCIWGEYEKGSVWVINGDFGIIDYDFLIVEEMNLFFFFYFDELYVYCYWDVNFIV